MSNHLFIEFLYSFIPDNNSFKLVKAPCIEVLEGEIVGFSSGCPPGSYKIPAVVLPSLCNAHVHLLDYAIVELGEDKQLEELVTLPQGLKYKALQSIKASILAEKLDRLVQSLLSNGTLYLGAYAELGRRGAEILARIARARGVRIRILAQPLEKNFIEYKGLLERYRGVGLDTVFDLSFSEIVELMGVAGRVNGHVHVHVSETSDLYKQRDYERVLRVKPSAAIHLTELSTEELLSIAQQGIGVIFCPRSNMYHRGKLPRLDTLPLLIEETLVALGTDNAAWIPPRIDEEASYSYISIHSYSRKEARRIATSILLGITSKCVRLLGLWDKDYDFLRRGITLSFIPEISWSSDPLITLVKRMSSHKLLGIIPGQATRVLGKIIGQSLY